MEFISILKQTTCRPRQYVLALILQEFFCKVLTRLSKKSLDGCSYMKEIKMEKKV